MEFERASDPGRRKGAEVSLSLIRAPPKSIVPAMTPHPTCGVNLDFHAKLSIKRRPPTSHRRSNGESELLPLLSDNEVTLLWCQWRIYREHQTDMPMPLSWDNVI